MCQEIHAHSSVPELGGRQIGGSASNSEVVIVQP